MDPSMLSGQMTDGFTVRRNNTCLANELDCGQTWGHWHNCCPQATYCGPGDYGNECWKTRSSPKEKRCANSTWDLYFAVDFFCCDRNAKGFEVNSNGFVGCAGLDEVLPEGETALSIIVPGLNRHSTTIPPTSTPTPSIPPTASSPSSSAVSTTLSTTQTTQSAISTAPTQPPNPSPTPSPPTSTNIAAIAGGVAGGVVALAILAFLFWFIRYHRSHTLRLNERAIPPAEFPASQPSQMVQKGPGWPQELEGQSSRPELDGRSFRQEPQELPASRF